MAAATLAVAIVGAATGIGSLAWNLVSWRREGWNLEVDVWWDSRDKQVHVEVTNVGRQACVVSEIRYFISDLSEGAGSWTEAVMLEYDDVPEPIAPSAKVEIVKDYAVPAEFSLEAWAWTGGRPYKSKKWTQRPPLGRPIEV